MSPHQVQCETSDNVAPWGQTFLRGLLAGLVVGACLALLTFFVMVMAFLGNA